MLNFFVDDINVAEFVFASMQAHVNVLSLANCAGNVSGAKLATL